MTENPTISVAERSSCWMKILKHKWIEGDLASKSCLVKGRGCTGHTCIWFNLFATHILWNISYFDPQFNTVNDNIPSGTSFIVSIHSQGKKPPKHVSKQAFYNLLFLVLGRFQTKVSRKNQATLFFLHYSSESCFQEHRRNITYSPNKLATMETKPVPAPISITFLSTKLHCLELVSKKWHRTRACWGGNPWTYWTN